MADGRRGLPRQPFYYTVEQVAHMLAMSEQRLKDSYLFLDGEDTGVYRAAFLRAVNFSVGLRRNNGFAQAQISDWRIAEGELVRWLTYHRLWLYPADPQGPYDPTAAEYDDKPDGRSTRLRRRDPEDLVFIEPRLDSSDAKDAHVNQ